MIAWLIQNAIVVIPLAACVAIACRLLRPAPAVCHALWLLVLLKLLMPPLPIWPSAWLVERLAVGRAAADSLQNNAVASSLPINAMPRAQSGVTARVIEIVLPLPENTASDASEIIESRSDPTELNAEFHALPLVVDGSGDPAATPAADWQVVALALVSLWMLGAIGAAICTFRRIWRLRRALKRSAPPAASFAGELAVLCRLLRVRLPNTRVCAGLPCPMVIALPRATLLWPAGLENRLDEPGRRAVLIHELAHLKRRDHLSAWLEVAVVCLWWWHPIVWWARRELRQYTELACDAWVVTQLPADRSCYAKALVDVCEFISLAKPAAAPAVGMARGNRRSFERRLHMILRQRIVARMPTLAWLTLIVAAVLVLPSFSTGQDSPEIPADSAAEPNSKTVESTLAPSTTSANVENEPNSPQPAQPAVSADVPGRPDEATSNTPANRTFPDEQLTGELQAVTRELKASRGKGKKVEQRTVDRAVAALGQLFEGFRTNGAPDDRVVREAFAWILRRVPNQGELDSWSQQLSLHDSVNPLIIGLLQSDEFADPAPASTRGARGQQSVTSGTIAPSSFVAATNLTRGKTARVQTLLRVVYDMPLDKAEILAKFLNDNVKGEIEARTDQEGLMVTADAGIQRTVAGIVALMTGEMVTLDLGGGSPVGHATVAVPLYQDPMNPSAGPKTYYAPALVAQPGSLPGVYPPPPAARREMRQRTVYEADPTTGAIRPRTVMEERVFPDEPAESRDRSLPSLTPQPAKKRPTESTKSSKEPSASASDSSSAFQFSGGIAE